MIKSYKDLDVYNLSYKLAMDIFFHTRNFSKEEIYSLTSQIVRSSRSISSNIVRAGQKESIPKNLRLNLSMPWALRLKLKIGFHSQKIVDTFQSNNSMNIQEN